MSQSLGNFSNLSMCNMFYSYGFRKTLTSLIFFNLVVFLVCNMMLLPMFLFQYLPEIRFYDVFFKPMCDF